MAKYLISAERTQRYTKVFEAPTAADAEALAQAELDESGLRGKPRNYGGFSGGRQGWDTDDEQDGPVLLSENTTEVGCGAEEAPAPAAAAAGQLADVVGTVSIDSGIATLPDGSTVDLRAASGSARSWYLVTARLAFDDEDDCFTLQATSMEDAMSQASDQLRERLDADEAERDDAREVYVNYVVRCGDVEPSIEKGAGQ